MIKFLNKLMKKRKRKIHQGWSSKQKIQIDETLMVLHLFPRLFKSSSVYVCVRFHFFKNNCGKSYPDRYFLKSSGIPDMSVSSSWFSFILLRASISERISESSEYRFNHSCSIVHSGCSKHDIIASKIFFLFRSTLMIKSSASSVSSLWDLIKIKLLAPSLWQTWKPKKCDFVTWEIRSINFTVEYGTVFSSLAEYYSLCWSRRAVWNLKTKQLKVELEYT